MTPTTSVPAIHVLGVDHSLQIGFHSRLYEPVPQTALVEFREHLESLIERNHIRCVYEEMTRGEVNRRAQADNAKSVPEIACENLRKRSYAIEHRMIDLTHDERKPFLNALNTERLKAGLDLLDGIPMVWREEIWLTRIIGGDIWPALLICGSEHTVSFPLAVLRTMQWSAAASRRPLCIVECGDWNPSRDARTRFVSNDEFNGEN